MPLYEYTSAAGGKVELHRSVEDRNKDVVIDGAVFKRSKFIPDSLLVFGSQPSAADAFDANILKQYYRKEEREGSRFRSGYSKKQLQKVYAHARKLT
jgi:hypothetical protein